MERIENFLSARDLKTRGRWLFWVIKLPVFIFVLVAMAFVGIAIVLGTHWLSQEINFQVIDFLVFSVTTTLPGFYILYYCAYRKHGTIFLTLSIICWSISFLYDCLILAISLESALTVYEVVLLLIDTAMTFLILYFSWQLLLINRKIQKNYIESQEYYKNALASFKAASNPEECKLVLDRLMEGVYAPKVRKGINYAYKNFLKRDQ